MKDLSEEQQNVINEIKDVEFRERLAEGFKNGTYMTVDEFCQRLDTLKTSHINKRNMKNGKGNS